MKTLKWTAWVSLCVSILMFAACGGGGGTGGSSGTVSMDITDAKPVLPEGAENLWITFEEILVHKSGGGWISLPLPETPYTIDLLQFYDGNSTELVPPVSLESGKYTQIRMVVSEAVIGIDDGENPGDYTITIPSGNLKTDKNFSFDVVGGGAVDITVDFDLSKSIVVTGPPESHSYKLKPVLHIVETFEAATISGKIDNGSFIDTQKPVVSLFVYNPDIEEYTDVEVSKSDTDPTEFSIYWLVPNRDYKVEIDFDPDEGDGAEYDEDVNADDLEPGEIFELNNGDPIVFP